MTLDEYVIEEHRLERFKVGVLCALGLLLGGTAYYLGQAHRENAALRKERDAWSERAVQAMQELREYKERTGN